MKLCLWYVAGAKETYADLAEQSLSAKINSIFPFDIAAVKAKSAAREDLKFKRESESRKLHELLKPDDFLWLFDEKGQVAKDSVEYSRWLVKAIESGKKRVVMMIGGPFGFSEELKARAQRQVSLSPLTMNHHVAKIVALEQTFRALSIWKNLPYHNC